VRAGNWKNTDEWWPIGTGIVSLSPFGPAVSDPIKSLVEQRKQDLIAGQFDVFWGPIKDQSGKMRIAPGEKPPDAVLLSMDWFVEGIVGTVPQ
jgi:basic membrane protein A and related proteins